MIRIFTGYSDGGGSTIAHINLVNELNKKQIPAILYGPHKWHLDKCNSALLSTFDRRINEEDTIIMHYLTPNTRPPCKQFFLSCHETVVYDLKKIKHDIFDFIHFVSEFQRDWQNINHPNIIIPPITYPVKWKNSNTGAAGVIGSIDSNKRTHLSIERAFSEGFKKVLLFGKLNQPQYFELYIKKYLESGKVLYMGHIDDKEYMYSLIDKVFHSSTIECCPLIKSECLLSGIPYSELSPLPNNNPMMPEKIMDEWMKVLRI